MSLSSLTAISPIDGRYSSKTAELKPYFSEFGLIKYRVHVEVEYFIALVEAQIVPLTDFPTDRFKDLRLLVSNFNEADAQWIKDTEKTTNHDVKAVEYFLKDRMSALGLENYLEFIHFGLTSQDINNTAVPLSLKDALHEQYLPLMNQLVEKLAALQHAWKDIPMLARTHGQPASPTRLGKEIQVFTERLKKQIDQLQSIPFSAKFGGATGNFNAHNVAYPNVDWVTFANSFVNNQLGLDRSQTTTQIEHYDNLAALFDGLKRINTIILDLDRDMWTYISMDYFKQKLKEGETHVGYKFMLKVNKSRDLKDNVVIPFSIKWDGTLSKYSGMDVIAENFGIIEKCKEGKRSAFQYETLSGEVLKVLEKDIDDAKDFWEIIMKETDLVYRIEKMYQIGKASNDILNIEADTTDMPRIINIPEEDEETEVVED
jgi:hypothetical protein